MDFHSIQQSILNGEKSCVSVTKDFLQRIEEKKELNAFLEVFSASALETAEKLDQRISNKEKVGKLAGMVIAVKDNICIQYKKLSASSKILEGFESLYSATAVERLIAEDAIIIGRTNCDEFAMGSSNEKSAFGPVRNALDPERVPGGSSGGSAVAVQAGLCHASLGSDTGGSIRQPASFCGIVGLKPTYGRISRHGLIAFGSSFDQIGPFTHSIEDAAMLLEVMAGPDAHDSTVSGRPTESYSRLEKVEPKKLAYFPEVTEHPDLEPEVRQAFQTFMDRLETQGHQLEAVHFEYLDYLIPAYYVMATAEASSNLARYDGIRYGYRNQDTHDMEEVYRKSRSEGFGKEVKNRILLGTFVLSSGYYDAYYGKAQKVRRLLYDKMATLMNDYDAIISPTAPSVAFKFGEKSSNPVDMYLSDIYTVLANLTGNPSISLPLYKNNAGLPIGIQLTGRQFGEKDLLNLSYHLMLNDA